MAATVTGGFPEIPAASITALGMSRAKPCRQGVVFVNGHYLPGPYVVRRMGTGIFIQAGDRETYQVTGQVRNWNKFLATQGGVGASSDDDFFDDDDTPEPAVGKKGAAKKGKTVTVTTSRKIGVGSASKGGSVTASAKGASTSAAVTFPTPQAAPAATATGNAADFVLNARARKLLDAIENAKTKIANALVADSAIFFSTRERLLILDARTAEMVLEALPEALKLATDADDLGQKLRAKGVSIFSPDRCAAFLRYRQDYPQLESRLVKMRKDSATRSILGGSHISR